MLTNIKPIEEAPKPAKVLNEKEKQAVKAYKDYLQVKDMTPEEQQVTFA